MPSQPVLEIGPDQSDSLAPGDSWTYRFQAKLEGDTGGVIDVEPLPQPAAWSVRLRNADGSADLTDTNGDGMPDLGYLEPGVETWFSLAVKTPPWLHGDAGVLDQAGFRIAAVMAGRPAVADTCYLSLVRSAAGTGLAVHNFPNPLTNRTTFVIALPVAGKVSLNVCTRAGERVCRVIARDDEPRPAGVYVVPWEAETDRGQQVAPGTYQYVLDFEHDDYVERVLKTLVVTRQ